MKSSSIGLPLQSRTKASLEILVVHRFAKVADHSILQSAIPDGLVGVCGHEDRRDCVSQVDEARVKLEPVISGMWTSATRHAVSGRKRDAKKSAADGNSSTV